MHFWHTLDRIFSRILHTRAWTWTRGTSQSCSWAETDKRCRTTGPLRLFMLCEQTISSLLLTINFCCWQQLACRKQQIAFADGGSYSTWMNYMWSKLMHKTAGHKQIETIDEYQPPKAEKCCEIIHASINMLIEEFEISVIIYYMLTYRPTQLHLSPAPHWRVLPPGEFNSSENHSHLFWKLRDDRCWSKCFPVMFLTNRHVTNKVIKLQTS